LAWKIDAMSDKEKEDISPDDSSDADDLDSLSAEEKAAFEKIMAEISAATGEAPETDAPGTTPAPPAETSSNEDTASPPEKGAVSDASNDASDAASSSDGNAGDADALSEDQQAALDKIMAEIESKRDPENEEKAPETQSQSNDKALSDDQQDALNQIMAEIESKRNVDRTESSETPEASSDDESLAEDQQEALDKIMAEIQAKKSRADAPDQKSNEDAEASSEETAGQKGDSDSNDLTLDEFDNELSNLLASTSDEEEAAPVAQNPPATSETPSDQEAEPAAQDALPESDQSSETGTTQPTLAVDAGKPVGERVRALREVTVEIPDLDQDEKQFRKASQKRHGRLRSTPVPVLVAVCLCVIILGGYSGYIKISQWRQIQSEASPSASLPTTETTETAETVTATMDAASISDPELSGRPLAITAINRGQQNTVQDKGEAAGPWIDALVAARNQTQNKISEIQSLKEYYRVGIDEDIREMAPLVTQDMATFEAAKAHKNIELTVRSIQRRATYILKLEVPLTKLGAIAEELLFLERSARLYETLSRGISGLSRVELQNQITLALAQHQQYSQALSIDDIAVNTPDLETTWQGILSRIDHNAQRISRQTPLNKAINAEICRGNYDRKFMLTALSPETAECLINWKGKDMNLNALTELSAGAAQILAQWPGEWMSLNGLKTLSAKTAKFLAQWPGKRLSLNGLAILSADTTANLSQWKGDQLEMIGLQSIGPWKNYGTRLFLSENLKRRLDIQ